MDFYDKVDEPLGNPFKEAPLSSPIMNNQNKINNNTTHSTHSTLHDDMIEERQSIQIRMRKSVHRAVGRYCGKDLSYGEFYEKSAVLFMDLNPKYDLPILVSNPQTNGSTTEVEGRMTELICIGDLEDFLDGMRRSRRVNGVHHSKIKRLRGIISECKKINNRGVKLNSLIDEALKYVL